MHYVVLDVFSKVDSTHFQDRAGATAVCWVREEVADKSGTLLRYLTTKMSLEGWMIAQTLAQHTVTEETYRQNPDGIELFQQAARDGFASNYRIRRREVIGGAAVGYGLKPEFEAFVRTLVSSGGASLYSEVEAGWATAPLGGGGALAPLCKAATDLAVYQPRWRSYAPRRLSYPVLDTEWLMLMYQSNLWLGLGLAPGTLTMFHPLAVRHAMTKRQ